MEELLKKLQEQMTSLSGKVDKSLETADTVAEMKGDIDALKGDLDEVKKDAQDVGAKTPELKDLSDKLVERLDGLERRLNETGKDVEAKSQDTAERKGFDDLANALLEGRDAVAELKSLDSDLKTQDVIYDDIATADYPLLAMVYTRPTKSDTPRYSYYTGHAVGIKGTSEETQGSRVKVELAVKTHEYQPTVDYEDLEDVGGQLFDDELAAATDGTRDKLNADLIDAIEAAGTASGSVSDAATEVAIIETDEASTIDDEDIYDLISQMPQKYRKGAVMIANTSMEAKIRAITDSATSERLWVKSLAQGAPDTLAGYRYIQDDNVEDDRIIFTNPRRGLAIMERQKVGLVNMERSGGDYTPYYAGRFARGVTDARASKILDIQ